MPSSKSSTLNLDHRTKKEVPQDLPHYLTSHRHHPSCRLPSLLQDLHLPSCRRLDHHRNRLAFRLCRCFDIADLGTAGFRTVDQGIAGSNNAVADHYYTYHHTR